MNYIVKNVQNDLVGHRLLVMQDKKTMEYISAYDTEIEARQYAGKMEYILKAITLDNRRIWLWETSSLSEAYQHKIELDRLLESF